MKDVKYINYNEFIENAIKNEYSNEHSKVTIIRVFQNGKFSSLYIANGIVEILNKGGIEYDKVLVSHNLPEVYIVIIEDYMNVLKQFKKGIIKTLEPLYEPLNKIISDIQLLRMYSKNLKNLGVDKIGQQKYEIIDKTKFEKEGTKYLNALKNFYNVIYEELDSALLSLVIDFMSSKSIRGLTKEKIKEKIEIMEELLNKLPRQYKKSITIQDNAYKALIDLYESIQLIYENKIPNDKTDYVSLPATYDVIQKSSKLSSNYVFNEQSYKVPLLEYIILMIGRNETKTRKTYNKSGKLSDEDIIDVIITFSKLLRYDIYKNIQNKIVKNSTLFVKTDDEGVKKLVDKYYIYSKNLPKQIKIFNVIYDILYDLINIIEAPTTTSERISILYGNIEKNFEDINVDDIQTMKIYILRNSGATILVETYVTEQILNNIQLLTRLLDPYRTHKDNKIHKGNKDILYDINYINKEIIESYKQQDNDTKKKIEDIMNFIFTTHYNTTIKIDDNYKISPQMTKYVVDYVIRKHRTVTKNDNTRKRN